MKALESGEIAQKSFKDFVEPFSESEYKGIMKDTFMAGEQVKNRNSITYTQFNSWIRVCHRLFSEFDKVEELSPAVVNRNKNQMVRTEFGRLIRDFASKLI